MELFSLLAKLTLDRKEYDKEVADLEHDRIELPDATIGLDDREFQQGIDEANDAEVNDLDADLTLDNTEFNDNLQDSQDQASQFSTSVGSVFKELGGVIAAAGIAATVAGIVKTLKEGVELAGKHGDTIDKQSKAMHLSRDAYQELSYAMELSGASITDLTRAMRNFDQIKGGNATDDQVAAFEALGISVEKAKDAQDLMLQSMYALADYGGEDKGVLAKALFGNNYGQFEALFDAGSEGIKDMQKEAHALGLIMTDEEINNAAAYTDSVTGLQGAIDGLKESFVADIMPVITDAINGLARIVAFFNGRTKNGSIADQWADSDKEFSKELATIEGTSAAAETLADKLLAMGGTSKMTADQYEVWKGTAEELIGLVPSLGEVIDTETGQINANSKEIKENIKQWEALAKQKALQTLKEEKYQAIVEKNQDLIDQTIEANKEAANAESKKAEAISRANDLLAQNEEVQANFRKAFGQDQITSYNQLQWLQVATQHYTGFSELDSLMNAFITASNDADAAAEKVTSLTEELEKGKQEYHEWLEAADQLYGGLGTDANTATSEADALKTALDEIPNEKHIKLIIDGKIPQYTYAKGAWTIPHDQVAVLHRGERVLTASQARQSDSQSVDYAVIGEMIAGSVESAMGKVYVMLNGDKVGDLTTKRVRNNVNAKSYSKLRALGG